MADPSESLLFAHKCAKSSTVFRGRAQECARSGALQDQAYPVTRAILCRQRWVVCKYRIQRHGLQANDRQSGRSTEWEPRTEVM